LYYRLSTITLRIPPLRERIDDVSALTSAFLQKTAAELGMPALSITQAFEEELARHSWPGNARELRQVIARAAILEDGPVLRGAYFVSDSPERSLGTRAARSRQITLEDIQHALEHSGGNKTAAAAMLSISRKTLYAKLMERR
jgi:DNA-binding NtrC family response regulator